MSHPRPTRRWRAVPAVLALVAVSACSESGSAAPATTEPTTVAAGASLAAAVPSVTAKLPPSLDPHISPPDLPPLPDDPPDVGGALHDATFSACDLGLGAKTVTAQLTASSAPRRTDYQLIVSWVNGSDVMGRAVSVVPGVMPGQAHTVTLRTTLTKPATECTYSVKFGSFAAARPVIRPTATPTLP